MTLPPEPTERRHIDRSPPAPLRVLGRARVRSDCGGAYPSFRREAWYPVVDRSPGALLALDVVPAVRGYMWVDLDGKGRHVKAGHFEVELLDDAGGARYPEADQLQGR